MDNSKLTISLLLVAFLLIIVTLVTLRKNKINVKFAIIWFIPAIAIALLALLPNLFIKFAQLFGFQTISNLIIGFILVLILFLIMSLTVIITGLSKKNVLLIQEIFPSVVLPAVYLIQSLRNYLPAVKKSLPSNIDLKKTDT